MENKRPPGTEQRKFAVPISRAYHHLKSSLFSDPKSRPLNPNPNNPKPLNSTSSANHYRADSGRSISDTSIGSSNLNDICSINHRSSLLHYTPPRAPLSDIGNRCNGVFGSVYGPKQVQEKARDKGKQICVHLPNSSEITRLRHTPAALPTRKKSDVVKGDSRSIGCNSSVNTRNKKKETVKPSSCPPIPRIRKKRVASREAGYSFTAPNLQGNKKKSRLSVEDDDSVFELPREFVEQQKAYFQEIDDFKLVEEVASESESDTEVHVGKT